MSNKHILTIYLIDGSKENYTFICDNDIDTIRNSLMKEASEDGILTLMTEDKRVMFYPLPSVLKITVSNVEEWQDAHTRYISVATKKA